VTSLQPAALGRPRNVSAEAGSAAAAGAAPISFLRRYVTKTVAVAEVEARKLRHDPTELFTRAIQPALWLLVFGTVMAKARAITVPPGFASYLDYLAPGILAQSVLFVAIFYGIAVIWERDLGILHKYLVSPTPRSALVLGKGLSAGVRSLSQVVLIYALAALLGVHINWNPLAVGAVLVVVFLGATLFSTISIIVASLVKSRDRFLGIGQVLTMPLFFASNAIYPVEAMPAWLQFISAANPLTYEVSALRALMVVTSNTLDYLSIAADVAILLVGVIIVTWIGAKIYPTVVNG
jgi:ABC-2 type transport system permease protein